MVRLLRDRARATVVAVVAMLAVAAHADTVFVDDDAPLGGDGLSWETAYRLLQDALFEAAADATIDEIRVAQGTYRPDQDEGGVVLPGDRDATFQLVNGVALLGGYAGLRQPDHDSRNVALNATFLSGDLLGDDSPGFVNYDENTYHVVTASNGVDGTAVLDGFTITGGNAESDPAGQPTTGGGLHMEAASPVISRCTITANIAYSGGGLALADGSPTIQDCVFTANLATATAGAARLMGEPQLTDCLFAGNVSESLWGGAIWALGSPVLTRCSFVENSAAWGGAIRCSADMVLEACEFIGNNGLAGAGGAIAASGGTTVAKGCTFTNNFSVYHGGAVSSVSGSFIAIDSLFEGNHALGDGGGFWSTYVSRNTLVGCEFIDNWAEGEFGGGAVHHDSFNLRVVNCEFFGNTAVNGDGGAIRCLISSIGEQPAALIHNCVISANAASGVGGGIYIQAARAMAVTNSTIIANTAGSGGGGAYFGEVHPSYYGLASIHNSIIRGNTSDQVGGFADPLPFPVRYCNVEGGFPGEGNIDADPFFVDADGRDFRLSAGSPCIDAGDNTVVPPDVPDVDGDGDTNEPIPFDLDGNPRFLEIPETPDTGAGDPPVVDMGAYESLGGGCLALTSQETVCHADGSTFTLSVEGVSACTGETVMATFTGSGGAVGDDFCFTVLVNGKQGGFCCSTLLCVPVPDCAYAGTVIYVDDDAPLGGDGLTWETAYRCLQDALAHAVARDEIHIAQGTYEPDKDEGGNVTPGDRDATFQLLDNVSLIGGFLGLSAGQGDDPDERDVDLYESTLNGDLLGDDRPGFLNHADNSAHLLTAIAIDGAVLDGLTVSGGNASDAGLESGGGLYAAMSGLTLDTCRFTNNFATDAGGGVYCFEGDLSVSGSTFSGNSSEDAGGIYVEDSVLVVADSAFIGNTTTGALTSAGAIHARDSELDLFRCIFEANAAHGSTLGTGGAMFLHGGTAAFDACSFTNNTCDTYGGAIHNAFANTSFIGCRFDGNEAADGGGGALLQFVNETTIVDCVFRNNMTGDRGGAFFSAVASPLVINSLFVGNTAASGAGVYNLHTGVQIEDPISPALINCTFSGNTATIEGGALLNRDSGGHVAALVDNCVVYGNTGGEIVNVAGAEASVRYSNVEGGFAGEGNIAADPLFVDPVRGDYRLQASSACIDAGDNTAVPEDIETDLDGNPRFLDVPETPDTGNGEPPIVDVGAYEFQPCPWDCDGSSDGSVNVSDLLAVLSQYDSQAPSSCTGGSCDFDDNGCVDAADLLKVLSHLSNDPEGIGCSQ